MARIRSVGFELDTNTAAIEFDSTSGTPTIQNTTLITGSWTGQIPSLTTGTAKFWNLQFATADVSTAHFTRFAFQLHTSTNVNTTIAQYGNDAGTAQPMNVVLTTTDTLQILNNLGVQVGSTSSALSKDVRHYIEIRYDPSGGAAATIVEARLDGSVFATSPVVSLATAVDNISFGGNLKGESATTGVWYFDDIAINDATGSFQNTYPGDGRIVRLAPNAAGDVNTFATQTGGTAGSANNFTRVNEVTPDGATTFNGSSTLNQEDLFKVNTAVVPTNATVNVVEVWAEFRNSTADPTAAIKFEIEKAAASTIQQSAAIVPNSTTFKQNALAVVRTAPLVTYQDPSSVNWNPATWTPQIGYKLTTAPGTAGRRIDVSNLVAIVDYLPNVSISQVAATLTTTTGTQSVATVNNVAVAQVAANATAQGGAQAVTTVNNITISQVAANITATGGTQAVTVASNVSIAQAAATLTTTTGTQVVSTGSNSTITQSAATLTATGGTQAVATVNDVSITQAAANLTATGGTQSITTVNNVSLTQLAATLTATGGTQLAQANSSNAQVAATLTVTGGTQVVASVQDVSISQVTATLTVAGGGTTVATVNDVSVTQVGANITATGGTQSLTAMVDIAIAQQAANLIVTGGVQTVAGTSATLNVTVAQVKASITATGGLQIISVNTSPLPPVRRAEVIFLLDGRVATRVSNNIYMPL